MCIWNIWTYYWWHQFNLTNCLILLKVYNSQTEKLSLFTRKYDKWFSAFKDYIIVSFFLLLISFRHERVFLIILLFFLIRLFIRQSQHIVLFITYTKFFSRLKILEGLFFFSLSSTLLNFFWYSFEKYILPNNRERT